MTEYTLSSGRKVRYFKDLAEQAAFEATLAPATKDRIPDAVVTALAALICFAPAIFFITVAILTGGGRHG